MTGYILVFRNCKDVQIMFQELYSRINGKYYQAAVKRVKSMYSSCNSNDAWNQDMLEKYQKCTSEIIESNREIGYNVKAIESYAINYSGTKSIEAEFDHALTDVEFEPNPSKAFNHAIKFLTNSFKSSTETLSCPKVVGCLERMREVVIRLKMITW